MIILKAEKISGSVLPYNRYDTISWEIRDNGHYYRVVTFKHFGVKKEAWGTLSPSEISLLKELIDKPWSDMNWGHDCSVWSIIGYDSKRRRKTSGVGFVHGVLEEITKLLPWPEEGELYLETPSK